jgi:hypothetical protein
VVFWFGFLIHARILGHYLNRFKRVLTGYFGLVGVGIGAGLCGLIRGFNRFPLS